MRILEHFTKLAGRLCKRFSSIGSTPEIHVTDDEYIVDDKAAAVGLDPAAAGRADEGHLVIGAPRADGGIKYSSVRIPRLKTFKEVYECFQNFICDGSCNPGGFVCVHVFVFACPRCGKPIRALADEMELFAMAGDDCVCMTCFEFEKLNDKAA